MLIEQELVVTPDEARDGSEALEEFKRKWGREQQCQNEACPKKQHRVILMDLNMPIKDGFDASREILAFARESCPAKAPKIMALTAFVGKDTVSKCEEIGMVEVLNKP
eukprot:CAMPEP_0168627602 /NCGR_PEP_ID=MMETSP0449_2-20121227/11350_1 /TAXON_ID=1082188 /ORGANISM="Strombidium rassoulzadegani, Strain ras09" /LENGTH=107 /DNA_ID=CAMNT_0008669869 /DNA_START=197 /DNA_END=516 /DNA_ORIENTATION=-